MHCEKREKKRFKMYFTMYNVDHNTCCIYAVEQPLFGVYRFDGFFLFSFGHDPEHVIWERVSSTGTTVCIASAAAAVETMVLSMVKRRCNWMRHACEAFAITVRSRVIAIENDVESWMSSGHIFILRENV